ncbi:MAG: UbiA family prenyltransferase [Thermoplasmatales archaeon]|nr:UbiA family prenyltransferase [Thermoplasmatales archaeon]
MVLCTSLITYSIYSLNRLTDIEEDASNLPDRVSFIQSKKTIILFLSLLSYLLALFLGGLMNKYTIPIFLIPFIMGLIYSIRISSFRLKDLFLAKNLTVSISWALSSALLPYVFGGNIVFAGMIFVFLFIKCFVNTVVFDVRDVEGDRKVRANTIPVIMGVNKTMKILLFVNSILFIWLFICIQKNFFMEYIPAILFSIIYGYIYIFLVCRKFSKNFNFDYMVDGEFIMLFLLSKFL